MEKVFPRIQTDLFRTAQGISAGVLRRHFS